MGDFHINEYTRGSLANIDRGWGTYTYVYAKKDEGDKVSVHIVTKNIFQRMFDSIYHAVTNNSFYEGKNSSIPIKDKNWNEIKNSLRDLKLDNVALDSTAEAIVNNRSWLTSSDKTDSVAKQTL